MIASIPTTYKDIEFRSRLEAKWAAFFDQCGWHWSYETLDFNGWISDFSIGQLPVLVEIKPFHHEAEWRDSIAKIINSGCTDPVILLGADATFRAWEDDCEDAPKIGWLSIFEGRRDDCEAGERSIWDLHFGFTEGNKKLGLCPMNGGWKNYIWNTDNPKSARVWLGQEDKRNTLIAFWREACNRSQWRPRNER